jgi:hypothetical protein
VLKAVERLEKCTPLTAGRALANGTVITNPEADKMKAAERHESRALSTAERDPASGTVIDFIYPMANRIRDTLDRQRAQHKRSRTEATASLLSQVILLVGMPMTIVGYIDSFNLVQNASNSWGPLIWLVLEVVAITAQNRHLRYFRTNMIILGCLLSSSSTLIVHYSPVINPTRKSRKSTSSL